MIDHINWQKVQEYYDEGKSSKEIAEHFDISINQIVHAKKRSLLKVKEKRKINWQEIQEYYDKGNTILETAEHFGINEWEIHHAKQKTLFRSNRGKNKKIIDWQEVQKYYDSWHTYAEISKEFGISKQTIYNAMAKGKFKSIPYRSKDTRIELICTNCKNTYITTQNLENKAAKKGRINNFCSQKCSGEYLKDQISIECTNCGKEIMRTKGKMKGCKNHFCSHSCWGKYTSTHKTWGKSRSKFEIFVEEQLSLLYKNLKIYYNNRKIVGSEIDILIPSLSLGIEINGPFHYRPIFSMEKLLKTQESDAIKKKLCLEKRIDLYIIDISQMSNFKVNKGQRYLEEILLIINRKIEIVSCSNPSYQSDNLQSLP